MKLYTEEQMIDAIASARFYTELIIPNNILLKKYTPIELPSRDMADEAALNNSVGSKIDFLNGFIWTCSRIREQIN